MAVRDQTGCKQWFYYWQELVIATTHFLTQAYIYLCVLFCCQLDCDQDQMIVPTRLVHTSWRWWTSTCRPQLHQESPTARTTTQRKPSVRTSPPASRKHSKVSPSDWTSKNITPHEIIQSSVSAWRWIMRISSYFLSTLSLCRWEGVGGAGRFWLPCSELRAGHPEKGEALCSDTVLPVHQHQHPLTTGHPLSG